VKMEVPSQVVPPVQTELTNTRKECEPVAAKSYETPWVQNDISLQAKDKEICYIPRDWVTEKLDQIKSSSSLSVNTYGLPETVKVVGNVLSFEIKNYMDKNTTMELHFFEDGIVKFNCINPTNPSQFSFELVDKPANLTAYSLEGRITVGISQVEVTMAEVKAKVVVKFAPFNVTLFSTKGNTEEVLFEMNSNSSLRFDENLTADFTFATEYLYGLPERATNLLLEDTKVDLPYRFYNQDVPDYPVGSKNSVYGAVPIIVGRSKNASTLVTMFWQNASDTYIDIHRDNASTKTFWLSERGNLECYMFISHDNKTHFRSLSNVFGHCAMPQYFALGYHQCRWSYEDQKDVLQVNRGFNENEIPCDSILSTSITLMDANISLGMKSYSLMFLLCNKKSLVMVVNSSPLLILILRLMMTIMFTLRQHQMSSSLRLRIMKPLLVNAGQEKVSILISSMRKPEIAGLLNMVMISISMLLLTCGLGMI